MNKHLEQFNTTSIGVPVVNVETGAKGILMAPYKGDYFSAGELAILGVEHSLAVVEVDDPSSVHFYPSLDKLTEKWRDYTQSDFMREALYEWGSD